MRIVEAGSLRLDDHAQAPERTRCAEARARPTPNRGSREPGPPSLRRGRRSGERCDGPARGAPFHPCPVLPFCPFLPDNQPQRETTHVSSEKVAMQRIRPHGPGLSRLLAARFVVLLMVSFYAAGLAI